MGGKPTRKRQHIYLCLALLTFLPGCSLLEVANRRWELQDLLANGNSLFARGDYDGSLKLFRRMIVLDNEQSPADAALYNIGLIYVHPSNPKRDPRTAMESFTQIVARFPESPWTDPAKIWLGMLSEAEESKQEIEKSKTAIQKSRQELELSRSALDKSRQESDKTRAELEKTKQEVEKAKQMIEKFRQVDIEIERKRRERGR